MTFLVLGATGLQGGAVANHLLDRGESVRVLTRNASSQEAQVLAARGAQVVSGDLQVPESLGPAFESVEGVFSVQDFYSPGVGLAGEIYQGRAVIKAAIHSGVKHIVQSTMGDGNAIGGPAHFLSKATIERDIKKSGLNWTLLGTVWFMDNLLNPAMKPTLLFPVLAGSLKRNTIFNMLAADDLGWMAAEALTNPSFWLGRKINMAGDAMTVLGMKQTYARVTGRQPKGWMIPRSLFQHLVPEFAEQLDWHNRINFAFGPDEFRSVHQNSTDFSGFLKRIKVPLM